MVKNNGWNPVWEEKFSLPFDCVGSMLDLIFVRFAVKQEGEDEEKLGVYCTSLLSLASGTYPTVIILYSIGPNLYYYRLPALTLA